MRLWVWIAIFIALAASYYLLNWVFWLSILILSCYLFVLLYRFIERMMTPHGKRIRHGALRGHLEVEYGTREGGRLYKEMVTALRKKGYR